MFFGNNFIINHSAHVNGKKVTKHIVEADIWVNSSVKNVALVLFVNESQVLIVTEKYNETGFIAGRLNRKKIPDRTNNSDWYYSTNGRHNLHPRFGFSPMSKQDIFSPLEKNGFCSKVGLIDKYYWNNTLTNKVESQASEKKFIEFEYEPEIDGLKREYKEETGHEFKNIQLIKKFVYNGHTAIFIGIATDTIQTKLGPGNDGEIISMQLIDINDLKFAINGTHPTIKFRNCAKFSTECVFTYLGLLESSVCNLEICDCVQKNRDTIFSGDKQNHQSSLR